MRVGYIGISRRFLRDLLELPEDCEIYDMEVDRLCDSLRLAISGPRLPEKEEGYRMERLTVFGLRTSVGEFKIDWDTTLPIKKAIEENEK